MVVYIAINTARSKCGWANVIWCAIHVNKGKVVKLCGRTKINDLRQDPRKQQTLSGERRTHLPLATLSG